MTTSFFWPYVNHFSCKQGGIGRKESCEEWESHESDFSEVVVIIIIQVEIEEFVLQENIFCAEESVEEIVSNSDGKSSSK